jgi:DNA polymerase-3 subunit gamma/tau
MADPADRSGDGAGGLVSEPEASGNAGGSGHEYVVVARRYRPQSFQELVGQGTVAQALCNAITTDRIGHAYLFTGARGVGKTSTARILAKALNCETGPTTAPCGECDICRQITSGEDMDVLEIDGASNRGIEDIRLLRSNVGIRPSRARFKVYIIDEVHMLTKEAFNALLKTLEEPPEHVKFIFCTTEPGKIPITVLSRCQRFDFAAVKTTEIAARLRYIVDREGMEADVEALELLARRAAGSMRDSQSLLEQVLSFVTDRITVAHIHALLGTAQDDRLHGLLQAMVQRNAAQALTLLHATLQEGVDAGQLAEQLVGSLRDLMVAHVGGAAELMLYYSPAQFEAMKAEAQSWGLETLLAAAQVLDQAMARMRHSTHPRLLLEMALIRIAELEDLASLSQLLAEMSAGEGGRPAASRPQPTPARPVPSLRDAMDEEAKKKSVELTAPAAPAASGGAGASIRVDAPHARTPGSHLTGSGSPSSPAAVPAFDRQDQATAKPPEGRQSENAAPVNSAPVNSTPESVTPVVASLAERTSTVDGDAIRPNSASGAASSAAEARRDARPASPASAETTDAPRPSVVEADASTGTGSRDVRLDTSVPTAADRERQMEPDGETVAAKVSAASEGMEPAGATLPDDATADAGLRSSDASQASESLRIPDWNPGQLKQRWLAALEEINDMTADHAGLADSVAISGPNQLVVRFRQVYNSSKSYCERPDKREALERAFGGQAGCRVRLEFVLLPDEAKPATPAPNPQLARTQLRQQVARHPLVQRAMELFEAEILHADRAPADRATVAADATGRPGSRPGGAAASGRLDGVDEPDDDLVD